MPDDPTTEQPTEKTSQQVPWMFGGYVGYPGYSGSYMLPSFKARLGSGALDGKNTYCPPLMAGVGGILGIPGPGLSNGRPFPQTFHTYRAMMQYPAIRLAAAAVILGIMAAEWLVEVDETLTPAIEEGTESPPDVQEMADAGEFGKKLIEQHIIKRRTTLMRDALRSLVYGFWSFELVKGEGDVDGTPVTVWRKVKALLPDNIDLVIDPHGNLQALMCGGIRLEKGEFAHIVNEREGDNWFGESRLEAAYRSWTNALQTEDELMSGVRKGVGKSVHVGVMPDEVDASGNYVHGVDSAGNPKNIAAGLRIGGAVMEGRPASYHRLSGLSASDLVNNPEAGKNPLTTIDIHDGGNPGPTIAAGLEVKRDFEKQMVRAWLQPERTLLEATTAGSRADSESHGDIVTADAEATHEAITAQIDEQIVQPLIRENLGDQYAGKIRLVAAPIADEQKAQLSKFFDTMTNDGSFVSKLTRAMGSESIKNVFEKLGLNIQWAEDIDLEPEPEPPPQLPGMEDAQDVEKENRKDDMDDSDDEEEATNELSAVLSLSASR